MTQELKPGLLPWQVDSLLLSHQGSQVEVSIQQISAIAIFIIFFEDFQVITLY